MSGIIVLLLLAILLLVGGAAVAGVAVLAAASHPTGGKDADGCRGVSIGLIIIGIAVVFFIVALNEAFT